MTELTDLRAHADTMATAAHRPTCLTRPKPWTKAVPTPGCTGCMTEQEAALWRQIADEIGAYLASADEGALW